MIDLSKQTQSTGDHSTAIQAQNVTIVQADRALIENVAHEVIEREVDALTQKAVQLFRSRTEDLVKGLIDRFAAAGTFNRDRIEDPRFQFALRDAQQEFGKSGSADLKADLINLLVRMNAEPRDELAKLYGEAIKTTPLLTRRQIDLITVVCSVRYLIFEPANLTQLVEQFQKQTFPFLETATQSPFDFNHIEYARCGQLDISSFSLGDVLRDNYPGLFSKGFAPDAIPAVITEATKKAFLVPCVRNNSLQQVNSLRLKTLDEQINQRNLAEEEANAIRNLFHQNLMSPDEIINELQQYDARFRRLADYIEMTAVKNLTLTSVGLIVAIVNIETKSDAQISLEGWFSGIDHG